MARGPFIRVHAERIHTRLRHPAVLIPAFLGGMLIARLEPMLRALPRVTTRLRDTTHQLREINAIVTLTATLVPLLLRQYGIAADDTSAAQSSPRQQDTGHHPPRT